MRYVCTRDYYLDLLIFPAQCGGPITPPCVTVLINAQRDAKAKTPEQEEKPESKEERDRRPW